MTIIDKMSSVEHGNPILMGMLSVFDLSGSLFRRKTEMPKPSNFDQEMRECFQEVGDCIRQAMGEVRKDEDFAKRYQAMEKHLSKAIQEYENESKSSEKR